MTFSVHFVLLLEAKQAQTYRKMFRLKISLLAFQGAGWSGSSGIISGTSACLHYGAS